MPRTITDIADAKLATLNERLAALNDTRRANLGNPAGDTGGIRSTSTKQRRQRDKRFFGAVDEYEQVRKRRDLLQTLRNKFVYYGRRRDTMDTMLGRGTDKDGKAWTAEERDWLRDARADAAMHRQSVAQKIREFEV